jgi:hypothetical protein
MEVALSILHICMFCEHWKRQGLKVSCSEVFPEARFNLWRVTAAIHSFNSEINSAWDTKYLLKKQMAHVKS